MEMNEKVSVIVVNYNAGPGVADSVASVIGDVHEVIVVDNASSDGSLELLVSAFGLNPKMGIVRNSSNQGFAKACNQGINKASGEIIFFLNPDCKLEPGAMLCLLESFQSDKEVGMVGGLLLNPDGSEQAGGRRAAPTPWRSFVRGFGLTRLSNRWPKLFYDFHLHKGPLPKSPIEVEAISGAYMLVKRAAVADVGLWDEGYFLHCEDLDWCMRFHQKKWKILFVPAARATHLQGTCSRSRPLFVEWHKHKGMVRYYRKFFRHQYSGLLMGMVFVGVWLHFSLVAFYFTIKRVLRGMGF